MSDVYDDLDHFDFSEELHKLRDENSKLLHRIRTLEDDCKCLSEKYTLSEEKVKQLLSNISSLHKTSTIEVRRKDRIIQELREKVDSITSRCDRPVNNVNQQKYSPEKALANHRRNHVADSISSDNSNRTNSQNIYTSNQTLRFSNFKEERSLPEKALIKLDHNRTLDNSYDKILESYSEAENTMKSEKTNHNKRTKTFENKSFNSTRSRQCISPRNTELSLARGDGLKQVYNKARSRSRSSGRRHNSYKKRSPSPHWNSESKKFHRDRSNSRDRKKHSYDSNYQSNKHGSYRNERDDRKDENKHSRRLDWLVSEINDN